MISIPIWQRCSKCINCESEEDFQAYIEKPGCIFGNDDETYDLYLSNGVVLEDLCHSSCTQQNAKGVDNLVLTFSQNQPEYEDDGMGGKLFISRKYVINARDIVAFCEKSYS
jgi:hypothetical protein